VKLTDQKGFTLSELLIAAGLSLAVMASIYGIFRSQTHTIKGQESRMEAHEYAMAILDVMVREIRNTGYFPTGTACGNVSNTAGVASATTSSFSLVYDKDGNGTCSGDDEVVTFAYDSVSRDVTRNSQALSEGNVTSVQFIYYPQQTSSTAPAPYCFSTGTPAGCSGNLASSLSSVQDYGFHNRAVKIRRNSAVSLALQCLPARIFVITDCPRSKHARICNFRMKKVGT
jgi:type II secretory pathway component PulJ